MKLTADVLVQLPFALDFCATRPHVEPLLCEMEGWHATLWFPPSMADGTDGKGVFANWAWWTGTTLRVVLERDVESVGDPDALRKRALETANMLIRRLLNSYRVRFGRADVHPVRIDPRALALSVTRENGAVEQLPEPEGAFFYQGMPSGPPLTTSVNAETLTALAADVQDGHEQPIAEQLALDAFALDLQGETERAAALRRLLKTTPGTEVPG